MQSVDGTAVGAARVGRPHGPSTLARLLAALVAGLSLAACAGPSPQVQVATADASQSATASTDAAGQAAANDSAAAATDASKPDSTGATASGDASPTAETADNSAPPTPPSTPSGEPQATDPAPAAPVAPATVAPQTAAVPQAQPEPAPTTGGVLPPGSGLATGRPYVVIRFAESNTDYEKALSEAVKRALARKPNLAFDLVAVTPRAGTAEELADLTNQAHVEAAAVMKSLSALGIGSERVSMMTWTGQPTDVNEIRLYIR